MGGSIKKQISRLLRSKKNHKYQVTLVLCLALIVALGTVAVLKLPGVAMTHQEKVLDCHFTGNAAHTHNDDCYDANGALVCPLAERPLHTHDASCYTAETRLICGQEESAGHQHTDGCYSLVRGDLICGQEESEEHTHTDDCYDWYEELTCGHSEGEGAHEHTDACYETVENLTCGLEELTEEHIHGEECFRVVELSADEVAELNETPAAVEVSKEFEAPETAGDAEAKAEAPANSAEASGEPAAADAAVAEPAVSESAAGIPEAPAEAETPSALAAIEDSLEADLVDMTEADDAAVEASFEDTVDVETAEESEASEEPEEAEEPEEEGGDPYADVESWSDWDAMFADLELTGHWDEDLITVAQTQLGYTESTANYIINEEGKRKGYTRYGDWYGSPYGDWCAMFVSFCLNYAEIPTDAMPIEASCPRWVDKLSDWGMYAEAGAYDPQPGDLIFFTRDGYSAAHVGIVYAAADGVVKTIEGNSADSVRNVKYDINDWHILGYGILPENPDAPVTEEVVPMPAMTFEAWADDVQVSVYAPDGAFPVGTVMYVTPVYDEAVLTAAAEAVGEKASGITAVDITFKSADGEEIEPATAISVTMATKDMPEEASIVHVDDNGDASVVDADVTTDQAVFESGAFSVYVVVDSGNGDNARATVNFYGQDAEGNAVFIASVKVKNSDTRTELNDIVYDPGAGTIPEGYTFYGWSVDDLASSAGTPYTDNYVGSAYTTETVGMTIEQVRDYIEGLTITEGDVLNVYAMLFTHYTVGYYEDSTLTVNLGSESVIVRNPGDEAAYTVNMGYTVTSSEKNFEGWLVADGGSKIKDYDYDPDSGEDPPIFANETEITITGNVKFSVSAPAGHWLVFDENGKGGTYNAPQFIKSDEVTQRPRPDAEMVRNGYTFGGWYSALSGTADDTGYTPVDESKPFEFGSGLDDYTTIYAKWISNTRANYVVLIWKQNVDGDGYDFAESITLTGNVGNTINTVSAQGSGDGRYARVNNVNKQYEGFHLKEFDQNVTINTEGNSVLNVYYDRNVVTLTFQHRGSGTSYVLDNENGTWAFINNEWVQLRYVPGEDGEEGYWTNDPEGKPYMVDDENGTYGLVEIDGEETYVPLTIEPNETETYYRPEYTFTRTPDDYTPNESEAVYGIDSNGDYVQLDVIEHTETTTETKTVYVLTNQLTAGNNYLIVSRNNAGNGNALGYVDYSSYGYGQYVSADSVTVNAATPTITNPWIDGSDVDSTSIWTVGNGYTFKNGNYYVSQEGGGYGGRSLAISTTSQNWNWNSGNNRLSCRPGNSTYYLRYNNGYGFDSGFGLSTSTYSIYLYQQTTAEFETTTTTYTYTLNGEDYTGNVYLRSSYSGNEYYAPSMLTERNGELYYLDQNEGSSGGYVTTVPDHTEVISYTYSYNGEPYYGHRYSETIHYTGPRYQQTTVNNNWIVDGVMTGLYGSTLSENGYTWLNDYWWYDSFDQGWGGGYSGAGTRTTFLDAFILSDGSSDETFYGFGGQGTNTIHFLKKNATGDGYTETNTVTSGNGTFYISDKYNGYKAVSYSTNNSTWTALGEKNASTGYYGSVSNYTDLYIRYDPKVYSILFQDGVYVDGNGNPVQGYSSRGQLKVVENIPYGSSVYSYNKGHENYYAPTYAGFVFDGWYLDDACTHPYTFNTMQEGITVYAKWIQVQYRVFLHSNVPTTDDTLTWGSENQNMSFRVSYGDKVSAPTGIRGGYEFVGWYTDENFTKVFNSNAYVLNETTVTTPYDKTTTMTDPEIKPWGIDEDDPNAFNSDLTGYNGGDRFWITKKLDLYAKWSKILEGADGINVVYDEDVAGGGQANTAPTDDAIYKDNTLAVAGAASKPNDADNYVFSHWVVQTWDENQGKYVDDENSDIVLPGGMFSVLADKAHVTRKLDGDNQPMVDSHGNPLYVYTVQLRAVYKEIEAEKPTHIPWYENDGTEAFHIDKNDSAAESDLSINEAVDIQPALTRTGYKFLGWARVVMGLTTDAVDTFETDSQYWTQTLTADDLFLKYVGAAEGTPAHYEATALTEGVTAGATVTQVAADEHPIYHAMFAVWEKNPTYLYIVKRDVTNPAAETPVYLAGAEFTLERKQGEGEDATYESVKTLTTEATATGVRFDIDINTLANGTYKLTESRIPAGYGSDFTGVEFTIEDGVITGEGFVYRTDDDNNSIYTYTVDNYKVADVTITKIVVNGKDGDDKIPFPISFTVNSEAPQVESLVGKDGGATVDGTAYQHTVTYEKVRYGSTIKVAEAENADFAAAYSIDGITDGITLNDSIVTDGKVNITVTNTRKTADIELQKHSDSGAALLPGAEFTLTEGSANAKHLVTVDGVSSWETVGTGLNHTIELTSGQMDITGLAYGTYTLTEKKAPDGYIIMSNTVTFTVDDDGVYFSKDGEDLVTELNDNGKLVAEIDGNTLHVYNTAGHALPHTGGVGTTIFYVVGGILVVGAAALLITKRRVRKDEGDDE